MTQLGNGLAAAKHHEDALTVREALRRRLGVREEIILVAQALRTRMVLLDGVKRPCG